MALIQLDVHLGKLWIHITALSLQCSRLSGEACVYEQVKRNLFAQFRALANNLTK